MKCHGGMMVVMCFRRDRIAGSNVIFFALRLPCWSVQMSVRVEAKPSGSFFPPQDDFQIERLDSRHYGRPASRKKRGADTAQRLGGPWLLRDWRSIGVASRSLEAPDGRYNWRWADRRSSESYYHFERL